MKEEKTKKKKQKFGVYTKYSDFNSGNLRFPFIYCDATFCSIFSDKNLRQKTSFLRNFVFTFILDTNLFIKLHLIEHLRNSASGDHFINKGPILLKKLYGCVLKKGHLKAKV